MSFEVLERVDGEERLILTFEQPETAQQYIKAIKESATDKGRVFFMRKAKGQDESWHSREIARFADGIYKRVPWYAESWAPIDHFAHVSTENPGMIAYTPSAEHGAADRQVRMRPGKYLESVVPRAKEWDSQNEDYSEWCARVQARIDSIKLWCTRYSLENERNELLFAATADEIQEVYENGPHSCMSHEASDYESSCHPVRVYAAGDLQVAYVEREGRITARALCWPERKVYGRVYGDESKLIELLDAEGYSSPRGWQSLQGAKLRKIEDGDCYVMPYIDGSHSVEDCGDYFRIGGDISADSTEGFIRNSFSTCVCCRAPVDEDDCYGYDGDDYCESCYNEYITNCSHCGEDGHRDNDWIVDAAGEHWCAHCARRYLTRCEDCEEYFHNPEMQAVTDDTEVCAGCARYLTHTPCGDLCRQGEEADCDCATCEESREEEESEPAGRIEDERQLEIDFSASPTPNTDVYTNSQYWCEAFNLLGTGPYMWKYNTTLRHAA